MSTRIIKVLSLILTLAILINLLPASAIAQTLQENNAASSETGEAAETSAEDVRILSENTDKRTAFTKDYKLSNGFNMSVVYPEVVHFEENGQWKEIDNTLKASGTGTNAVYTNTTGGWNAVFPQQLTKSSRVSVVKDGYAVSFGMAGELRSNAELMSENGQASRAASAGEELSVTQMQTATAQIAQRASAEELAEMEHPEIVREKLHSRLTYEDVYSNIDIVYDLNGYQLKESVVINSYDSKVRGYQYVLETGSLTPVLNEDGSIDLFAPGTEEPIMEMPAPYMVDSSGAVSYDVDISLVPQDGNYMLTYRIPTAWLADSARIWPVVLDPIVTALSHRDNILDQFVAEYYSESYTGGALYCGYYPDFGKMRSYIQYENLPNLTSADVVVHAELSLKYLGGNSTTTTIEAHKVNTDWHSQTITWATQPQYNNTVEDFAIVNSSTDRYEWVITDLVRDWYTSANTGVMLKAPDSVEAGPTNNWKKFYSIDFDRYDSTISPYLNIVYRNTNGLESYWDYTATSAGRAGTGYVNNYSGNLTWVRSDLGFAGNLMPVSISHVYNANDAQSNSFGLGYGWKTNYHQTIEKVVVVDDANNELLTDAVYVWTDGDGTKHYFVSENNKYVDEDGLELELTVTSSGYKITDKDGNTSNFDSQGRLISLFNNQQAKSGIYIVYQGNSNRIEEIEDGAGRIYKFTYNNYLLDRISYRGRGSKEFAYVTFGYTGSTLTSVTDKDGETIEYEYGTGNLLTTVLDIDGYKIQYAYCTTEPKRVVGIEECDNDIEGGTLTFAYSQNQTALTDHKDNTQILQFNNWGNVISVQDNEGHAQFAQYAANWHGETGKTSNQLALSSKMQNTVVSYFKDKSFENGTTWIALSSNVTCLNSGTTAYYGNKSLQITRAASGATSGVRYTAGYLAGADTFTFSAWVKTDSTASAYLQLTSEAGEVGRSEVLPASSDWTRLEVNFAHTTNARVYPEVILETSGTVYVDCVQIEKAETASRYNLLDNGDFRYSTYSWSRGSGLTTADKHETCDTSAFPKLSAAAFAITGNPTGQKYLYQTVKVSGSAGDCYVLGGWAKGDSVPLGEVRGVNREFGLKLIFNNTDSSKTTRYVSFNCDLPSSGNWQYAATAAVAEKPYSSITVQLVYNYNANTVYFDGIQLFKEQFGSSYTYDSNGNVTKVEDLQKQETEYKYENNKLTEIIQNGNAKMTYEYYENSHNVKKATSSEGLIYEFTYDQYGNNTSVSIVNGNTRITSSAVYSTNGNLLVSTTDALDKTTTYGYNEDTNVLEWVQYPNDTDATRTEYSYDSMYRLASSSVDLDPNTTLSVSYTYTDDLLTKIQTASTTYNFSYGDFSQRTGVSIGTRTLATYSYTNNQNRYLQQLTYGNGDYVQYTYDSHGRVVRETYEDGSTVSYAYDNSGALATVTDSKTGITTKYYYDLTDRMMKYVESGDGYSHSVGYEYDTLNNLTHLVETINGVKHTTEYNYDDDNRVVYIINGINNGTVNQEARRDYIYDDFGRVTQRVTKQNGTQLLTETITYVGNSTQVASITTVSDGYSVTYSYTYDNNGNISTVSDGTYCTQYFYDTANQLIRENNQQGNFTCVWTYDDAGNILTRTVYPYTTGEPGQAQDSVAYTYGNSEWGDLLTAYDGITVEYDEIGNPLNDGTWDYIWEQGRQLVSMYAEDVGGEANDITIDYVYDANGMRIGKTVTKRNYLTHQHSYTATVVAPTCTEGGYTWYECDCGDAYQGDTTPATGHSYTATVVAPTCTEGGYTQYECACGDAYQGDATPATGHNYSETVVAPTCTEGGYTWYECACGDTYQDDATPATGHSYAKTVVAPTCTEGGYTVFECACGDTYQGDAMPATGHNHAATVIAPTCTDGGYTLHECVCGDSYQTDATAALGHEYTETIIEDPDTQERYTLYSCIRCDYSYTAHAHTYVATVIAPTCTESGYTLNECACGDSYQSDPTAATGHNYTSTVVAPTCTEAGYTLRECACGDSYRSDPTAATGHNYTSTVVAPTCTEAGYTLHECACGDSYQSDPAAATGHTYTTTVIAPTCTEAGYTLHTCACGDSYQTDPTAATGHNYTSTVVAPTCTEAGYTLHECDCGYSYQDNHTDALEHDFVVVISETTGRMVKKCTRCGYETGVADIPIVPPVNPPIDVMSYSLNAGEERTLESTVVQEYSYVYNGGTLMQMVIETTVDDGAPVTETLSFSYDASGMPMSVVYNGTAYFYTVNLQGDVMAIVDATGNAVVSYAYDAWGNILSVTGTTADTLGESNPLRYRGYVYDNETELYYLQSRYYDPELGRFINADAFASTGQGVLGNNMFAYCNNRPNSYVDHSGNLPKLIEGIVRRGQALAEDIEEKTSRINGTVSRGKALGVSIGIIAVTICPCVSFDAHGNIEFQYSYSWSITSNPGFGGSVGYSSMITNAPSVEKLRGESGVIGGSMFYPVDGIPVGGGVDINLIPDNDQDKTYFGLSNMIGVSTSAVPEFHVGPSNTISIVQVNVFDAIYAVCDWLLGG